MDLARRVSGALYWRLRALGRRAEALLAEGQASLRHRRYRRTYGPAAPSPYDLIEINPADVEHLLEPRFDERLSDHGTHILGGEWDRNTASRGLMYANRYEAVFDVPTLVPFERFGFYQAAEQRYDEGADWEETAFYEWCLERIEKDLPRSPRFATETDLHDRLSLFDQLYHEIEAHGYRTQRELEADDEVSYHKSLWPPERHEVSVSIGRTGEIIFDEGQHRFIIARLLSIPTIPVRVIVRHTGWQTTRDRVAKELRAGRGLASAFEEVAPDHPDMADILGDEPPRTSSR